MYQLTRRQEAVRDRTLEIAFLAPGAEASRRRRPAGQRRPTSITLDG
jgi:hypothetical protein